MDSDLIRGHVDTIILNILAEGDKYGYEIIDEVQKRSSGNFELKQPTLYSCLNRMEKNGLISSYWLDSDIGGRRHYYKLTESGKETFEENQRKWIESSNIINKLIFNADYKPITSDNFIEETQSNQIDQNKISPDTSIEDNFNESNDDEESLKSPIIEKKYYMVEENENNLLEPQDNNNIDINSDNSNKIYFLIDDHYKDEANKDLLQLDNKTEEIKEINTDETKQIEFFEQNNQENDEILPDLTDEESRLMGFFDVANKITEEKFDKNEFDNFVKSEKNTEFDNFNLSDYYSSKEDSFYSANRNGDAVIPDYSTKDNFVSSEISPDEVSFVTNSDVSEPDDNNDDEEINYAFEDNNFEDQTTEENFDTQEEKTYFDINLDDNNEDTDDTSFEQNENNKETQNINKIEDNENHEIYSKDDLNETVKQSYEEAINQNNELYQKESSLDGYKPRYTDTDYQEILGDLTSYSNGKLVKPNYNEPSPTSMSKIEKSFEETRQSLEKEGISVKLHSKFEKENPNSRSYILSNKIKMVCSYIVFVLMCAALSLTYIITSSLHYLDASFYKSGLYFIIAGCVLFLIPLAYTINYYINPMKKKIPKYSAKYSIIFAIIFVIQALLLVYSFNIAFGFYSFNQSDYNHLNWLVPAVCSLVILFTSLVYTALFKSKRFHV